MRGQQASTGKPLAALLPEDSSAGHSCRAEGTSGRLFPASWENDLSAELGRNGLQGPDKV